MTLPRSNAPSEIVQWDADTLSRHIHTRTVSCREVMHAYLARIDAVNPTYNAIVSLQPAEALLRQADERDAQLARGESMGWMHGMPQAIKDMANVAGLPTTLGSPLMQGFVAKEDGLMAARMKAAGCVVVGKTNTPEFGLGSHTFNEVFGVTRNAYDPSRSAGGSSGGAAVALAQRLLPVADGSDFMGSLRNPAGWNNVFGFRPSQSRVPMAPAADVWVSQLGTEGPMGRTVRDVAKLLVVQAGRSDLAPLSIANNDHWTWTEGQFDLKGVRIGWLGDLGGHLAFEDGILDVCRSALGRLADGGAGVDNVAPAFAPDQVWDAWLVWRRVLVAARIAPFVTNPKNRELIKPEALWEYDQAQGLPATKFLAASTQRTTFYQQMLAMLQTHEVLALPVAQVWPFDAALRWPEAIQGRAMDTYHRWMEVVIYATFAGLPCISVPAGFSAAGLPMGVQLIGRPQADARLLQVAAAYEARAQDVLQIAPSQQAR
jgi:amidase